MISMFENTLRDAAGKLRLAAKIVLVLGLVVAVAMIAMAGVRVAMMRQDAQCAGDRAHRDPERRKGGSHGYARCGNARSRECADQRTRSHGGPCRYACASDDRQSRL